MSIALQAKKISKRFGATIIFDDASVTIGETDKVGVIGRNGAGKSTFCRFLSGEDEPDSGEISLHPRLRLGYLQQHDPFGPADTVLEFLVRSSGLPEWDCARMAARFQLRGDLLQAVIASLPGGYQTRVKLAHMLLGAPTFLVLDEPTNYLDVETLILLERLLDEFRGGFLIVSHDREFLKRTCDRTLEVDGGRMELFPGGVEEYLAFKEEEREHHERQNRKIEAKRKHLQDYVDRNRVRAATASRAQSKLKELERLRPIEIEHRASTARIKIPPVDQKPGIAFSCEDLAIGYPGKVVAKDVRLEIERGERVAVVGQNGQGKTTFLRTIAGELPALAGKVRWGHALEAAYYAQHVYTTLPPDRSVFEHLEKCAASGLLRQDVLDMAGSFLFSGDDVHQKIGTLSGGERARAALAALLLARRSVLLLDEPTNHLDFETAEALAEALRAHRGTIFFVSHDRTFVHLVATNVIEVRSGKVTLYPDGYDAYLYRIEKEADAARDDASQTTRSSEKPKGGSDYERRKELKAQRKRLVRDLESAEKKVAALVAERESINRYYLERPTAYSPERAERLAAIGTELASAENRWIELQEELEKQDSGAEA
jgi:ATP-binding cassette subfamily F protein 3